MRMSPALVDLLGLLAKSAVNQLIAEMQKEQKTSDDSLADIQLLKMVA